MTISTPSTGEARRSVAGTPAIRRVAVPTLVRQVAILFRERRETSRAYARIRWELNQNSDHALADMGLCRSDIEDLVRGVATRADPSDRMVINESQRG